MAERQASRWGLICHAHRNIRLRLAVTFINRFLNYLLTPLMGILFAASFGTAVAGVMLLVVAVAAIAFTFVGGHLAEVRGRRGTLLISEAGVVVAYGVMALANSPWWHSVAITYGCFLLNACLGGLGFPANDAVMIDVAKPDIRVALYTLIYWLQNIAAAAALTIGGFSYGPHFEVLPLIGLVLSSSAYLLTVFALAETKPRLPVERWGADRWRRRAWAGVMEYRSTLRDRPFLHLTAASVLLAALGVQLSYYLGIHLAASFHPQTFHLAGARLAVDGVRMVSIMRTLNTVLVIALALAVGSLLRKVPGQLRLLAGIALFSGGYAAIALTVNPWLLIGLSVVYSTGELMHTPARQVLLADLAATDQRARYMALYGMRFRLGGVIASVLVIIGSFVPAIGMAAVYGLLGIASAVLLLRPLRAQRNRADTVRPVPSVPSPSPSEQDLTSDCPRPQPQPASAPPVP